ncbi:related to nuclear protein bimA [Melanopsichium pennsylvanicum]|uniref:Related to nuclear protein bimA n=2 Tax=Melanopsichium pennsylvanicum TaxID=63383 RepID=A0AAJ4XNP6_9BASI|nr:related to nuclear protein bimA [Melanopsichium pennsylvanicum 4]SNX85567.1 related to nuclear protein bimA [Melanopsichium pennsylvanicum]
MPLASTATKSRSTVPKSRQPISSTLTSSSHLTSTSARVKATAAAQSASSPLQLELPPSLPTISDLQSLYSIQPSPQLIARRLLSLARSFLSVHHDNASPDPLDSEFDLCSATFFSIFALCLDPNSTIARRTLARCARLGGFNIFLPFSPSGSAASATVSAAKLSSQDPHDLAGAQACIHILQQGSASTFQDAGSAREYRDACRTLGRSSDAIQVADVLQHKVLGKRKAADPSAEDSSLPQIVAPQSRHLSQLQTDAAYNAASRGHANEAQSSFVKALEQDPFNWRAWTGLCDTGYGAGQARQHFDATTLDRLYSSLVNNAQAPYLSLEATLKSSPPFSNEQLPSSAMVRKVSEDGSNKKLKVSSEIPPVPSSGANAARLAAPRPIDKVTPPLPTISASPVTATRLHPTSRALSAAQTNTHHLEIMSADHDDVKGAKVTNVSARSTRTAAVRTATLTHPATTQNGRQLRSTAIRGNPAASATCAVVRASAVPGRAGATSQAGSISSTSSGASTSSMSSRSTVSTARTAVSTRKVASAAPSQVIARAGATKPTSASSTRMASTAHASGLAPKRGPATATARTTTASSVSRPGSAMSKASATSVGGASTFTRSNGTLASARTAAEAMRLKEEENAKSQLELLKAMRTTVVQQLAMLAHQHTADQYVLALLAQVGEAYRLLRLCEGEKAAALLANTVIAEASTMFKCANANMPSDDPKEEDPLTKANTEISRILEVRFKDSLVHHLLLGRSYAECSQYAPSETHFTAARKLNPFVASHMDVYSLVLFHLSREVKLSALAQHLAMAASGTASTHIVIGNAFSLQKEHQTALVCFQRAAAAAPEYAYAYTLAGHEAHDLGLHDEAIAYFRSAIRCDRRHWNAWAGLGRVYLGIGEHEHAACKCLQQAIQINPGNHVLWDLVGWTFSLINAPAKALECYDRAIELAPSAGVLTYLRRAELLLQHGDAEGSHRDLVNAHDLAPEEASVHVLLAQSYMRLGGGAFCHLEGGGQIAQGKASTALRASGVMVLPSAHQAEITHHLNVAIDLDPSLLRVVKSICEGYKTLPSSKLNIHPHDFTSASLTHSHRCVADSYEQSGADMESNSQMQTGYEGQSFNLSYRSQMADSTPQHASLLVPVDFAASHPHDSSSFLSISTAAHSTNDIVLEDAEVSS